MTNAYEIVGGLANGEWAPCGQVALGAKLACQHRGSMKWIFRGGFMRTRLVPILALGMIPAAMAQSPGTFTRSGDMTTKRFGHTATLLTTGTVLITGGEADDNSAIATAELYDPTMRTFAPTGDMTRPRLAHTASLLPRGKILITGGGSYWGLGTSASASAELYDPATGTFTATGDMITARQGHTATLLNNGKVLIAGATIRTRATVNVAIWLARSCTIL
jgi:hypothetical protein